MSAVRSDSGDAYCRDALFSARFASTEHATINNNVINYFAATPFPTIDPLFACLSNSFFPYHISHQVIEPSVWLAHLTQHIEHILLHRSDSGSPFSIHSVAQHIIYLYHVHEYTLYLYGIHHFTLRCRSPKRFSLLFFACVKDAFSEGAASAKSCQPERIAHILYIVWRTRRVCI